MGVYLNGCVKLTHFLHIIYLEIMGYVSAILMPKRFQISQKKNRTKKKPS